MVVVNGMEDKKQIDNHDIRMAFLRPEKPTCHEVNIMISALLHLKPLPILTRETSVVGHD